jgi:hypothetical protein
VTDPKPNPTVTKSQMVRLQTLYGQLAAHTLEGNDRASRLKWASEQSGRAIASFKELTSNEAKSMIDGLQGQLGVREPAYKRPRRRLSRDAAKRAGTEGRRGNTDYQGQPQMASAEDLAVIESYYMRLGWQRAQFDAWLASSHSPLSGRAQPVISTSKDANRVRWALKGMLKHRGLWEEIKR